MSKPMVILVHGVGGHTSDSFKQQVCNALDAVSKHYANVPLFSDHFDIQVIAYNNIFQKILNNAREAGVDGLSAANASVLRTLAEYQDRIAEDDFFTENALDAVVYKTYLAGAVEAEAAEQFYSLYNQTVSGGNVRDCHVICHSLGTTVMHNVLHRLYATQDIDGRASYLSATSNKLKSITTLANVSRLFPRPVDPYRSIVCPGPQGICNNMLDARHKYDPVPIIRPFAPDAAWDDTTRRGFESVTFSEVVDLRAIDPSIIDEAESKLNVHAVEHYLTAPMVHNALFRRLLPMPQWPQRAEVDAFTALWKSKTLVRSMIDDFRNRTGTPDIVNGNLEDVEKLRKIWEQLAAFFRH